MSKIQAMMVLEMLGRPAEHLAESLNSVLEKLQAEKGVKIIEKTVHEPAPVENTKDLFTAFAELEVEFDELGNYLGILFAYLPSHMEIIYPEKITIKNSDFNELTSSLIQRMHNYDAIAKKMLAEREIIAEKIKKVAPQLFEKHEKKKQEAQKTKQDD